MVDEMVSVRSASVRFNPPSKNSLKYVGSNSLLLLRISGLLKMLRKKCASHAHQSVQVDVSKGAARNAANGSKNALVAITNTL